MVPRPAQASPQGHLRSSDLLGAYRLVCELGEAQAGSERVRLALTGTASLIASDLTTLSVCDLRHGRRHVEMNPQAALSTADREAFDRHFFEHPLVCFHAANPYAGATCLSDFYSRRAIENLPLYQDYYRPLRLQAVMALPLHIDQQVLVSVVLNRQRGAFSERERQLADLLRLGLAAQLKHLFTTTTNGWMAADTPPPASGATLTEREREILHWVGTGKSNVEIAWILAISPRTVQKHLEHVFDKLGVENRLAALLRVKALPEEVPGG